MTERPQSRRKAGRRSAFFYESFASLKEDFMVRTLHRLTEEEGIRVYLVGGVLRDAALRGRWTKDYDVVTEDGSERVAMWIASKFGAKGFLMDPERDIWRVVKKRGSPQFTIDIAPIDGATIEEDLRKRDFTINSLAVDIERLYCSPTLSVFDPAGGIEDLRLRRLRLTSPDGFKRDPLRLLRALRLCQLHHLRLERTTRRLIKEQAPLIKGVAPERIKEELLIIFSHPDTARTIKELFRLNLVEYILPELNSWRQCRGYDILSHSLKTLEEAEGVLEDRLMREFPSLKEHFSGELPSGVTRGAVFKLAALLHDCGKPATMKVERGELKFWGHDVEGERLSKNILKRIRVGRKTSNIVSTIVRNHHRLFTLVQLENPTDRAKNHFFNALGGELGLDLLCLGIADARATRGGEDPELYAFVKEMLRFYFEVYTRERPEPILDGHEIMEIFGVEQGPMVGRIKRKIEEGVEKGIVRDKESAIEYVREWLKGGCSG